MTKPILTIRYATIDDAENVANFRIEQYKSAKEFKICDLSALSQQRGKIYIAELDNNIISTMQIEVIETIQDAIKLTHTIVPNNFSRFNTLYLSKAATLKEYHNIGLNSYLRLLSIEHALTKENVNSLIGVAYENAPRLNLLKKLGYEFTEVQLLNNEYTNPYGKVYLLSLDKFNFKSAHKLLQEELQELEGNFTINVQIN